MFFPTTFRRVCLVNNRVDFRKGHQGLLAEAYRVGLAPYDGDVVVFVGRRKSGIKILVADSTGLWVNYKIFHNGCVPRDFKFIDDPSATTIAPSVAAKLIEGSKFFPQPQT